MRTSDWSSDVCSSDLFSRSSPDQLRVMRDILGPACATIGGKDPGNKIRFLGYPQVDHGLGTEYPRRPPPYILALGRAAGNIRRMFESARAGQMIGPCLRPPPPPPIPPPRRNPP